MTKTILANTPTQVNAENIGVQVVRTTTPTGVTVSDYVTTRYTIASTLEIEGTSRQFFFDRSFYVLLYSTGNQAVVDNDTYDEFTPYLLSNGKCTNEYFATTTGCTYTNSPIWIKEDSGGWGTVYTLDYDQDTQTYSNPVVVSNGEYLSEDRYAYPVGIYTYHSVNYTALNRVNPYSSGCFFALGKYVLQIPGDENNLFYGEALLDWPTDDEQVLVYMIEGIITETVTDFSLGQMVFSFDSNPQSCTGATYKIPDGYTHSQPVDIVVDDENTWRFYGFIPTSDGHPAVGDTFYVSPGDMWVEDYQGRTLLIPATVDAVNEVTSEVNCTVSYSVDGQTFTEVEDAMTDDNNIICNIPRYMYLKFSQDVEITEE